MSRIFLSIDNKVNLIDIDTRMCYVHCSTDNQIYQLGKVNFETFIKYMFSEHYNNTREIILADVIAINDEEFIYSMVGYGASAVQHPPKI